MNAEEFPGEPLHSLVHRSISNCDEYFFSGIEEQLAEWIGAGSGRLSQKLLAQQYIHKLTNESLSNCDISFDSSGTIIASVQHGLHKYISRKNPLSLLANILELLTYVAEFTIVMMWVHINWRKRRVIPRNVRHGQVVYTHSNERE